MVCGNEEKHPTNMKSKERFLGIFLKATKSNFWKIGIATLTLY
jgi:hypothetical protein